MGGGIAPVPDAIFVAAGGVAAEAPSAASGVALLVLIHVLATRPERVRSPVSLETREGRFAEGRLRSHRVLKRDQVQRRVARVRLATQHLLLAPSVQQGGVKDSVVPEGIQFLVDFRQLGVDLSPPSL